MFTCTNKILINKKISINTLWGGGNTIEGFRHSFGHNLWGNPCVAFWTKEINFFF